MHICKKPHQNRLRESHNRPSLGRECKNRQIPKFANNPTACHKAARQLADDFQASCGVFCDDFGKWPELRGHWPEVTETLRTGQGHAGQHVLRVW